MSLKKLIIIASFSQLWFVSKSYVETEKLCLRRYYTQYIASYYSYSDRPNIFNVVKT